ncbi:hypothetical protein Tco_1408595 [Tanacetum coccineum]
MGIVGANLGIKSKASAKYETNIEQQNLERFGRSSPFDSKLCHGTFDHHVVKENGYLDLGERIVGIQGSLYANTTRVVIAVIFTLWVWNVLLGRVPEVEAWF